MLIEDYEKALQAQQQPIVWKKIGDKHYINPDTGVEIKYGWDRLPRETEDRDWCYGWYIYEPQPGKSLTKWVFGRQFSFQDAVEYDANGAVQSIRFAREDRSFADDWQAWNEHLDVDYYADRHPA